MRFRKMDRVLLFAFFVAIASTAHAQTDVALSFFGAFTGTTSGNGVQQSPVNQAGGMVELRHIVNPLIGYEATYSYNRANQEYLSKLFVPVCPTGQNNCLIPFYAGISNNEHEITGDWVVSLKLANLRPFALAGGGLLINVPTGGTLISNAEGSALSLKSAAPTSSAVTGVFVYGAGLDWGLLPHLGLRVQYRGNVYKLPDLTSTFQSTNAFTHTAEPMIGAYFRF